MLTVLRVLLSFTTYWQSKQTQTTGKTHSRNSILVVWLGKFYLKCVVVLWWSGWQRGGAKVLVTAAREVRGGAIQWKGPCPIVAAARWEAAGSDSLPQSISETTSVPSSWAQLVRTVVRQRRSSASSKETTTTFSSLTYETIAAGRARGSLPRGKKTNNKNKQ